MRTVNQRHLHSGSSYFITTYAPLYGPFQDSKNHCFYYVYTPLTMARTPLQSILSQLQNQRFPYLQNQRPTVLIYSMNVLLPSPAPGLSRATFLGTYSTLPLSPDLLPLAPQKGRFNIKAWCAAPKRKFSLPDAAKFHA